MFIQPHSAVVLSFSVSLDVVFFRMSSSRLASLSIHICTRSFFSFSLSILFFEYAIFFFLLACSYTVLHITHSISFLSDDDALPFPLSSLASRDQPYTVLRSVTITLIVPFFCFLQLLLDSPCISYHFRVSRRSAHVQIHNMKLLPMSLYTL